ncbi:MAG: GAF domain-containing protein [Candidatus Heimdallarchaeota archaeon]
MVDFEDLCKEILIAAIRNYQRYMNAGKSTLDNQHKFLTQTAIMRQLWSRVEGQRGYRSKQLLATAFRELQSRKWLSSRKGKQNALLYFPTDGGMKAFSEYVAHERPQVDNFNGKQSYLMNARQQNQSSLDIGEVLQALRYHFEHQLKEESVLSTISGRFAAFSSFGEAVESSLSEIGKLLGADRAFLKLFHEKKGWLPNEFEWCAPGVSSAISQLVDYQPSKFPWSLEKLRSVPNIWIQDENNLLERETDEQEWLWNQNARSLLILPLFAGETFRGVLSIVDLQSSRGVMDDDIRLLQVCCEIIAAALERLEMNHALGERVKELNCLYQIGNIVQDSRLNLKQVFKKIVRLLPPAWQYPEIAGGSIVIKSEQFSTSRFSPSKWTQSAVISSNGDKIGSITVSYSEQPSDEGAGEGPFLKEERLLIETIAERLGKIYSLKQTEEAILFANRLLLIANHHTELEPLLAEFLTEIGDFSGCAAVGIRVLDEEGNIPYVAYRGFSESFYESESPLSVKSDVCMCTNVIKGEIDSSLSFYTNEGSFYMNTTTRFLATVSEEEKGTTCNECNVVGYESVALIPIRFSGNILGLIHIADYLENKVPLDMITALENAAMQLGETLHRVKTETERLDLERTVNELKTAGIPTQAK